MPPRLPNEDGFCLSGCVVRLLMCEVGRFGWIGSVELKARRGEARRGGTARSGRSVLARLQSQVQVCTLSAVCPQPGCLCLPHAQPRVQVQSQCFRHSYIVESSGGGDWPACGSTEDYLHNGQRLNPHPWRQDRPVWIGLAKLTKADWFADFLTSCFAFA